MLLGVVGDPILHSLSPNIHKEALNYHNHEGSYLRILPNSIESAITFAKEVGITCLNITSPFKEKVCAYLTERSEEVSILNACNTLLIDGERVVGSNTDQFGVTDALEAEGIEISGKNVLVLGFGGAGRAAVFGVKNKGAIVSVLNRSEVKSKLNIKSDFLSSETLEREVKRAEIIINTLPIEEALKEINIRSDQVILEAKYSHRERTDGRVISGKRWLLYQGSKSSEIFLNLKTPIQIFEKGLLKEKFPKKVAFIGMMGSGKTTVGKALSSIGSKVFIDSDQAIEKRANNAVVDIFKREGEKKFRELEKIAIFEALEKGVQVLSLGGGATESPDIFKVIKEEFLTIWLWAPKDICLGRIGEERPLKDKFEELLKARAKTYGGLSDLVIADNENSPEVIAKKITNEIESNH